MKSLNPLTLTLSGMQLIEASAGTGKTYTIANLYLRLLLEKQWLPSQILVVTFTQAATEELRDRIRGRISDAKLAFKRGHSDDLFIQTLIEQQSDAKIGIDQLDYAIKNIDEAAIFTIHGFCNRTLNENAFESGTLFEFEFIQDESAYLQQVIEDFWRLRLYHASSALTSYIIGKWPEPNALLNHIRRYLPYHQLNIIPIINAPDLDSLINDYFTTFEALKKTWNHQGEQIKEIILTTSQLNRKRYQKRHVENWLQQIDHFVNTDPPEITPPKNLERFTTTTIVNNCKKEQAPLEHPFFDLCEQLLKQCQLIPVFIVKDALVYCKQQLQTLKSEHGVISFDDLLINLLTSLTSPHGHLLAGKLRQQYPAALIDEFQDTDPVQYQIFERIYQNQDKTVMLMIGDPKQAIYSFRGGDIFTYIHAKKQTDAKLGQHTLDTNWRSTSDMVNVINGLFQNSTAPFIFDADIPFQSVKAAGLVDTAPLLINEKTPPPLHFWILKRAEQNTKNVKFMIPDNPSPITRPMIKSNWANQQSTSLVAREIATLLSQDVATINQSPVEARNIAILVQNRYQANEMQQALRDFNIASVFYSRESVFDSIEAQELQFVLNAIANPENDRVIKTALTTDMMGTSAQRLQQLEAQELLLEQTILQFEIYRQYWQTTSFMAMFRKMLHEQAISTRLLQMTDGERRITNLLQLAEILQAQSNKVNSIQGLINWLLVQRHHDERPDIDGQQLRLESDEALVKIITIHKSKGLEYDIVFLPFIWKGTKLRQNTNECLCHSTNHTDIILDLGSDHQASNHQQAEKESLAEQLRLLYVALTRARYRSYLIWGPMELAPFSALAYLLHQPETGTDLITRTPGQMAALEDHELLALLHNLAAKTNHLISLCDDTNETISAPASLDSSLKEPLHTRHFNGHIDKAWYVSSFSGLTSSHHDSEVIPDYDPVPLVKAASDSLLRHDYDSIFAFPKGARAGTFMHSLFENIEFTQINDPLYVSEIISKQITQYGFNIEWQPVIALMVQQVLNTELNHGTGLKLCKVKPQQRLVELQFHFPINELSASVMNPIVENKNLPPAEPLKFNSIQGMMKGFVDLIFCYQGQYFIVDYKSNHLGDQREDYHQSNIAQAIIEHRYDVQYLIYTVALHRYLKLRLPDYQYQRDFGGIYYLFLRGMDVSADTDDGVYFHKPDLQQVNDLDQLFSQ